MPIVRTSMRSKDVRCLASRRVHRRFEDLAVVAAKQPISFGIQSTVVKLKLKQMNQYEIVAVFADAADIDDGGVVRRKHASIDPEREAVDLHRHAPRFVSRQLADSSVQFLLFFKHIQIQIRNKTVSDINSDLMMSYTSFASGLSNLLLSNTPSSFYV
jgi:hypothetical protein